MLLFAETKKGWEKVDSSAAYTTFNTVDVKCVGVIVMLVVVAKTNTVFNRLQIRHATSAVM